MTLKSGSVSRGLWKVVISRSPSILDAKERAPRTISSRNMVRRPRSLSCSPKRTMEPISSLIWPKVSGDTMTRPSRSVGRRSVVCDDHPSRPTRSISYLDFEGLIPASRNIYLRFKGLPECGTRSISGCSALESCGSHGVYTRAPTPRNAVRCLSEPQSTPRNEDSPRISRSSFERRMCSTVKHADEQACQRRNDPSQLELLQRQHVQYGL